MTASVLLEHPCNKSDTPMKLVKICQQAETGKLSVGNKFKRCVSFKPHRNSSGSPTFDTQKSKIYFSIRPTDKWSKIGYRAV